MKPPSKRLQRTARGVTALCEIHTCQENKGTEPFVRDVSDLGERALKQQREVGAVWKLQSLPKWQNYSSAFFCDNSLTKHDSDLHFHQFFHQGPRIQRWHSPWQRLPLNTASCAACARGCAHNRKKLTNLCRTFPGYQIILFGLKSPTLGAGISQCWGFGPPPGLYSLHPWLNNTTGCVYWQRGGCRAEGNRNLFGLGCTESGGFFEVICGTSPYASPLSANTITSMWTIISSFVPWVFSLLNPACTLHRNLVHFSQWTFAILVCGKHQINSFILTS